MLVRCTGKAPKAVQCDVRKITKHNLVEMWSPFTFKIKLSEKKILTTTTIVRCSREKLVEPAVKKQRLCFSFSEDERICLSVIATIQQGSRITIPVLGASWFQKNLVETGLLQGRTRQSIYQRFKSKLQSLVSDAVAQAKEWDACSREALKMLVLERLRELHGLMEEVELVQVELTPIVLEF